MLQVDPLGLASRWKLGDELGGRYAMGAAVSAGIQSYPFFLCAPENRD
jgi:hypothetical protein